MTTIVTRTTVGSNTGKGSPLTHTEVDTNFVNLNTAKLETAAIPLGTLQAPSVSFLNDSDTGIFCPQGGNSLAVATGGQYAITCTSTQAVGIKTANPQKALHVAGPTRVGADDATDAFLEIGEGATGNRNSYIDIVADTTYTDYGLRVIRNNTGANATSELKHRGTGALNFTTQEAAPIVFNTTNSPALTILAGGSVGIGTSSPNQLLEVNGFIRGGSYQFRTSGTDIAEYIGFGNSNGPTLEFYGSATGLAGAFVAKTAGTERLRIDSSGRVGIGTTAPGDVLDTAAGNYRGITIKCGTTAHRPTLSFFNTADSLAAYIQATGSSLAFGRVSIDYGGHTESGRFDSSGRLLVGTPTSLNSNALLQVYKASGVLLSIVDSDSLSDGEGAYFRVNGGTASGEFGAYKHSGIASPCIFLDIQAQDGASNYYWTDNSDIFRTSTDSANIGTTGGTVVGTQSSDERIKDILGPVEYGLDILKQIEPVRYTLKTEPDTEKLGFIAQQVQPLVPQSVFDTKEHIEGEPEDAPTKLGMEYVALLPVLVNAIKELSAKNDALEARLAALESA